MSGRCCSAGPALRGREAGHAGKEALGLLLHLLLHLAHQQARLVEVAAHHVLDHRVLAGHELRPGLRREGLALIQAAGLLAQVAVHLDEALQVLLEIGAHQALHGVAVEADDLRQHLGREHRHAGALLFQDDLQQDAAGQVLAALGVAHLEGLGLQHHLLDIAESDVAAGAGVIETAVRVLLQHAQPVGATGLGLGLGGAAIRWHANFSCVRCTKILGIRLTGLRSGFAPEFIESSGSRTDRKCKSVGLALQAWVPRGRTKKKTEPANRAREWRGTNEKGAGINRRLLDIW